MEFKIKAKKISNIREQRGKKIQKHSTRGLSQPKTNQTHPIFANPNKTKQVYSDLSWKKSPPKPPQIAQKRIYLQRVIFLPKVIFSQKTSL